MIGQTIGSYTILEKLGAGGMGEVYLATHRRIARRAAIKLLLPGLSKDAELLDRFFNEARATSLISHPGIVQILDCDVFEDRAYIVMEYLQGENLAQLLARLGGGLADEALAATFVIGQLADALAAAHGKGIIHRDLKPENVFLIRTADQRLSAKILDFGIAKLATGDSGLPVSRTTPGSILGTPSYMAPEQCRGLPSVDARVDIYSLGCIYFEMLTGRRVFETEIPGDLLVAHILTPPPRVSTLVPGIPAAIDDLIWQMLAKEPDQRIQTMGALTAVITQILGGSLEDFARRVPGFGRLLPLAAARRATEVMPSQPTPAGDSGRVASSVAPASPASISGKSGGTMMLPQDGGTPSAVREGSVTDSTFRRSASEVIRPPGRAVRRSLLVGGAALGLALVVVAVVSSRSPRPGPAPDEIPKPSPSAQPSAAMPAAPALPAPTAVDAQPPEQRLPPPAAVAADPPPPAPAVSPDGDARKKDRPASRRSLKVRPNGDDQKRKPQTPPAKDYYHPVGD